MNLQVAGSTEGIFPEPARRMQARSLLLACGMVATVIYVGSDIMAALSWEGYSYTAQSVSELRAIEAPTRAFLMPLLTAYALLEFALAAGMWMAAGGRRSVRIAAAALFALGAVDLLAFFTPMHLRGSAGSLTDTLHIFATIADLVLMLTVLIFGANAGGRAFRYYTWATLLLFVIMGAWALSGGPQIAANLPTPWLGVRERINIYAYMVWLFVLAIVLMRSQSAARQVSRETQTSQLAQC